MGNHSAHDLRYEKTLQLIHSHFTLQDRILDIGSENPFSQILKKEGYTLYNTGVTDLDLNPEVVKDFEVEAVSALEIIEHLVSPFPLLKNLPGKKLIATIPLRLWFSRAYKNPHNPWDWHFHEFEDWQFDWLLKKSGWKVIHKEKWKSPSGKIGIRPFLRNITPRYYAVYAERV